MEKHYAVSDEGKLIEVHDPGSTGHILNVMHAIVAVDENGGEGIMGMSTSNGHMPLIAADRELIEKMLDSAQKMVELTGKHSLRVIEFSSRRVLHEYTP